MTTQTSLMAEQVRLQQWAEQVRDCKNRPRGMDVETWCAQNNITKANYYYRLRRVRKACLDQMQTEQSNFIELPLPSEENVSVGTENVPERPFQPSVLKRKKAFLLKYIFYIVTLNIFIFFYANSQHTFFILFTSQLGKRTIVGVAF